MEGRLILPVRSIRDWIYLDNLSDSGLVLYSKVTSTNVIAAQRSPAIRICGCWYG